MANNKVAKKEQGSNIVDISLLLEDAETGHNMSNDDMMIPRLRILQTGSPQVNKREGQYVEGAEAGHIFDSVSNKAYDGEAGLTVVPVSYRTTFIEWKADRKGLVADHGNKPELLNNCTQSEKGKYFTPEGNEMVRSAEYFVYVVAEDGSYTPALISMASSGLKKSRRWNSMINRLQIPHPNGSGTINPAMFWTAYKIFSVPESNDDGSWFNWEIEMLYDAKSGGVIDNLENGTQLYLEARSFKKKIAEGDVKVSPETETSSEEDSF
jgi:hypothetical protein|tara:strand:- start:371 stop:1171 length:801 start_codon:yes stop_codon:yes gene_type:complete